MIEQEPERNVRDRGYKSVAWATTAVELMGVEGMINKGEARWKE